MADVLARISDSDLDLLHHEEAEDGFGALSCAQGLLPLKSMDVRTSIHGLVARTTLRQTFVNTFDASIEATYIFPLPARAATTHFRFEVAGRTIEGELQERGAARRAYNQALATGHRAAIAEEDRSGVFTMRVGNIMPGEIATVELTLCGPLTCQDGEVTYRFPLVVGQRYIPGDTLPGESVGDGTASDTDAVPDASRISPPVLLPGFPNPVQLSLTVELETGGLDVSALRASLHTVIVSEKRGRVRVRLEPGERLDKDFILRFNLASDTVERSLLVHPDDTGDAGTFMLTLLPPQVQPGARRPRDIVFVLDRSGSMGGWKMVAARNAMSRMVETLLDEDRFSIYAFDSVLETPPEFEGRALVSATPHHRFLAVDYLAGVEARGGTEMTQPLGEAANRLSQTDKERDPLLVLVTDGQVGNENQILRSLKKQIRNIRVYTVGIDRAVNEGFLRKLAEAGGGAFELVESEDRLDDVMERIHRNIGTPVLTDLELEIEGARLEAESVIPSRLPALFSGTPLVVSGRYAGTPPRGMEIHGTDASGEPWSDAIPAVEVEDDSLVSVWARGRVRDLEDAFAVSSSGSLREKIIDTSLRFSVLSRFTAFVAVDTTEVVQPGGPEHQVTQAVESVDTPDAKPQAMGGKKRDAKQKVPSPGGVFKRARAESPMEEASSALDLSAMSFDDDEVMGDMPMMSGAPAPSMMPGAPLPSPAEHSSYGAPMGMQQARMSQIHRGEVKSRSKWLLLLLILVILALLAYFLLG